jgi:hypothetical protein
LSLDGVAGIDGTRELGLRILRRGLSCEGFASSDVERTFTRALELSEQPTTSRD